MDTSGVLSSRRELGRSLAALREGVGYTQVAFAPLVAYSRSTLANVETGRQHVGRDFWVRCDHALATGGQLAAGYDRVVAARRAGQLGAVQGAPALRVAADGHSEVPPAAARIGGVSGAGYYSGRLDEDGRIGEMIDAAAAESAGDAGAASVGLDGRSVEDLFDDVTDVARRYGTVDRVSTFLHARRVRDVACRLAPGTRRPAQLMDLHLVASLTHALMASAAFDLAQWPAAMSLTRASGTYARLSGHASMTAWTQGLLAILMNWHGRPDAALGQVGRALALCPAGVDAFRLHHIAARAHALRGERLAAQAALRQAEHHRSDGLSHRDVLHDDIGGEFRFDAARADACAGAVWLHLGDGAEADRCLRAALAIYAAEPVNDRPGAPMSGAWVDLAAAGLLREDLDAAAEALAQTFALGPQQHISVLAARVAHVRAALRRPRWRDDPRARALVGGIDDWMTRTAARSNELS